MLEENCDFVKVGKVMDAHALKGDVFVLIFSGDISWVDEVDSCFLSKNSEECTDFRQLQIEKMSPFKNGLRIKFRGIDDRNASEALKGYFLYLNADHFVSEDGETIYLREILGFEVLRADLTLLGTIEGFSTNGAQDLLVIRTVQKVIEVPFVQAYTVEINYDSKQIVLDLPEGMEDLDS